MSLLGIYLVIEVNGAAVADTTDVNVKVVSDTINSSSQDTGVADAFIAGKMKIGVAGKFLFTDDWATLYNYKKNGYLVDVRLYHDSVEILGGSGVIKKLSAGGDLKNGITGVYGIRVFSSDAIITEDFFEILTEAGETIIQE